MLSLSSNKDTAHNSQSRWLQHPCSSPTLTIPAEHRISGICAISCQDKNEETNMSTGPMTLCGAANNNVESQAQALATVSEVQWLMLVRSQ